MLVIGSTALRRWQPSRVPHDLDVIGTEQELAVLVPLAEAVVQHNQWKTGLRFKEFGWIDFEVAGPAGRAYMAHAEQVRALQALVDNNPVDIYGIKADVASPEILLSLKKSHINRKRNWQKHIEDYHYLKGLIGGDLVPHLTRLRKTETEERIGKVVTPSLDKTADDFFNDNVSNRHFIHDDIHEVMSHRDRPMFEYIKESVDKVKCSKAKFDALPYEDRLRCVLEEAYVIALERKILPAVYDNALPVTPEEALRYSLMRICTTLCSGWFREFAVENYPAIWDSRNPGYMDKFFEAVDNGRINPVKEDNQTSSPAPK